MWHWNESTWHCCDIFKYVIGSIFTVSISIFIVSIFTVSVLYCDIDSVTLEWVDVTLMWQWAYSKMLHWLSPTWQTWLISNMTHVNVCQDLFRRVVWLVHMCDMTRSYVWHHSSIRVTWLISTCDMTRSYVWHDSFICVTWHIHMCDLTHSFVWYDSSQRVTWLVHTCGTTRSYMWHVSVNSRRHLRTRHVSQPYVSLATYWCMRHIQTCGITHSNHLDDAFKCMR